MLRMSPPLDSRQAYKSGNAPGPVPALPLYANSVKPFVTSNKDIEFAASTPLI